jgi:hypothetical protein
MRPDRGCTGGSRPARRPPLPARAFPCPRHARFFPAQRDRDPSPSPRPRIARGDSRSASAVARAGGLISRPYYSWRATAKHQRDPPPTDAYMDRGRFNLLRLLLDSRAITPHERWAALGWEVILAMGAGLSWCLAQFWPRGPWYGSAASVIRRFRSLQSLRL